MGHLRQNSYQIDGIGSPRSPLARRDGSSSSVCCDLNSAIFDSCAAPKVFRVTNHHSLGCLSKSRRYGVLQRYGCQADGNDCQNNFSVSVGSHGGLLCERSLCQIVCTAQLGVSCAGGMPVGAALLATILLTSWWPYGNCGLFDARLKIARQN